MRVEPWEAVPTREPPQGWTVADVENLPPSDLRYELVDGVPCVMRAPSSGHQFALRRLISALEQAAPAELMVCGGVGVVLAEDQRPLPDLVVVRDPDPEQNNFPGHEIALVGEVVSPSTRSNDRIRKPALYAQAGIPGYLRVELDPLHVVAYRLDPEGVYAEYARAAAGEILRMEVPYPVSFDPAVLLRFKP